MLVGTAPVEPIAARAVPVERFSGETVELADATVVLANFELPYAVREALLPPSLHPNTPPLLAVLAWRCPESPWGPFALAQLRVGSRSGVRTRGFLLGAGIDNPDAATALAAGWGLATRPAAVRLRVGYDASSVTVAFDDRAGGVDALRLRLLDPEPLGPDDVQLSGTLTPAETARGLRLVQFEPDYVVHRSERVRPRLDGLDAAAWGEPRAVPREPIAASVMTATVVLRPVRFVCRADVTGFEGTEPVDA
ncbi:MAG TPA: hypothetical protein VFC99_18610 [Acidimicrobiia bacterium]|nr:hypothetical protein [Acidimicrobiia bacterium]